MLRKRLKEPLFIRHTRTKPRHTNTAEDRTNPDSQLRTINLNPFYKGKLKGQRVVVLDDYLTYGVSFSVAAAFLRQAGVAKVIGVSMGKFGNCARRYTINIHDDPFAPITKWDVSGSVAMVGDVEREATIAFLDKFRDKI